MRRKRRLVNLNCREVGKTQSEDAANMPEFSKTLDIDQTSSFQLHTPLPILLVVIFKFTSANTQIPPTPPHKKLMLF